SNVTVFGQSAGGMSVATLLGTPSAAGLFHKAIAQSGAAENVVPADAASIVTAGIVSALGGSAEALLSASVEELLAAQQAAAQGPGPRPSTPGTLALQFGPVVDGVVLPEPPLAAIAAGSSARVPLLVGNTA